MKIKNILLIILIVILLLSFFSKQEDNITGFATKKKASIKVRDEYNQCKLEASREYGKCTRNRIYQSKKEIKICYRKLTLMINECIKKREQNRRSLFL